MLSGCAAKLGTAAVWALCALTLAQALCSAKQHSTSSALRKLMAVGALEVAGVRDQRQLARVRFVKLAVDHFELHVEGCAAQEVELVSRFGQLLTAPRQILGIVAAQADAQAGFIHLMDLETLERRQFDEH